MCQDERCPFKRECFRFTAKPDGYQSYFTESPYNVKKNKCGYFMMGLFTQDAPNENKAVEFADKLIDLILKYEIGPATFEKATVILENKHVFAEVDKKKTKRTRAKAKEQESGPQCQLPKKKPTVTLSLDDGECNS